MAQGKLMSSMGRKQHGLWSFLCRSLLCNFRAFSQTPTDKVNAINGTWMYVCLQAQTIDTQASPCTSFPTCWCSFDIIKIWTHSSSARNLKWCVPPGILAKVLWLSIKKKREKRLGYTHKTKHYTSAMTHTKFNNHIEYLHKMSHLSCVGGATLKAALQDKYYSSKLNYRKTAWRNLVNYSYTGKVKQCTLLKTKKETKPKKTWNWQCACD